MRRRIDRRLLGLLGALALLLLLNAAITLDARLEQGAAV